ncbi:MAG TPA: hypothetical protein VGJ39_03195 [Vicinamibacterales bacterium]|jgi:hypothetical protein
MFTRAITCLLVLSAVSPASAADKWPPDGWRFPTTADNTKQWAELDPSLPVPFHVSGDFNGDGLTDHAWILVGDAHDAFGLFVLLGARGKDPRVIKVFAYQECCAQSYALGLAQPGRHFTVCGRGRSDCPEFVTLKNQGFEFMTLGTASALFYWSPRAKRFMSVPVSD